MLLDALYRSMVDGGSRKGDITLRDKRNGKRGVLLELGSWWNKPG